MSTSSIAARAIRLALRPEARRLLATHAPAASSSSASNGAAWTPRIAPGVEPAYDEALAFIADHQARMRSELEQLRKELKETTDEEAKLELEAQIHSTEIASEINDPAIRYAFTQGNADLSRPVFRHLYAQSWRANQQTQLLTRMRDMSIVPDVLPVFTPSAHLSLAYGEGLGFDDTQNPESRGGNVGTAAWVPARFSMKEPQVTATPLHTEEKLYTLALVDTDVPDVPTQRLTTWCHWLIKDIPLSATKTEITSRSGTLLLPYIAPHPAQGSTTRRLVLVLLAQSTSSSGAAAESVERAHFSVRDYAQAHEATPAGAAFWRCKWTEEDAHAISAVWAKHRREQREPKFGKIPKLGTTKRSAPRSKYFD